MWMNELKKIHPHIGYSGHERGINISLAAVALGACVIERHFTLNREMEGPDHSASLEFDDFSKLVNGIREIEKSLGDGKSRKLSQGELINRENLAKSLIASMPIKKDTVIKEFHIKVRSPGQGLSPQKIDKLIGKKIRRDLDEEDFFYESDITEEILHNKKYNFIRPWGIPVRFHDLDIFEKISKPNLFEFHLSYSDMDLEINDYLRKIYDIDFAVHAPELFKNSMLMDLATDNKEIKEKSIKETQRVIDLTRKLKKFFS